MSTRTLPTVWRLTRGQREATHCVWCSAVLGDDAIREGLAVGYWGAHNRSVAVYACPTTCAKEQGETQWQTRGPALCAPETSRPDPAASLATAGPRTPNRVSTAASP
ncbi:hypothetical protein H4687_005798 [Streptomyces stelliscabiei]|uniref:Uncharacterized protein n=1 Tax=Streptomyces stelliscabiei TaxID=146820 RepID=A0A8I0PBH9_9ACTN|nr:hypothetical protein [Streptomyces stelliscabiei]